MSYRALYKRIVRFAREEHGNASLEVLLWMPALVLAFQLVTDSTVALLSKQSFYNVARDASRMVALGERTTQEAEEYIAVALADVAGIDASVVIENNIVTTRVATDIDNVTSLSGSFVDKQLTAKVSMWIENYEG